MKKRIFKGLAMASLSLTLVICMICFTPKANAATQERGEEIYNDYYYNVYLLIRGEEPPLYTEMLDSCSGSHMQWSNQQVIDAVYLDMLEFIINNASTVIDYSFAEGYEIGKNDCSIGHDIIKEQGFGEGYDYGYDEGKSQGVLEGKELGIDEGKKQGIILGYQQYENEQGSAFKIKDIIFQIINAPFNIFKNALNFEIFGINLWALVSFIISICIVAFVIKLFI